MNRAVLLAVALGSNVAALALVATSPSSSLAVFPAGLVAAAPEDSTDQAPTVVNEHSVDQQSAGAPTRCDVPKETAGEHGGPIHEPPPVRSAPSTRSVEAPAAPAPETENRWIEAKDGSRTMRTTSGYTRVRAYKSRTSS